MHKLIKEIGRENFESILEGFISVCFVYDRLDDIYDIINNLEYGEYHVFCPREWLRNEGDHFAGVYFWCWLVDTIGDSGVSSLCGWLEFDDAAVVVDILRDRVRYFDGGVPCD